MDPAVRKFLLLAGVVAGVVVLWPLAVFAVTLALGLLALIILAIVIFLVLGRFRLRKLLRDAARQANGTRSTPGPSPPRNDAAGPIDAAFKVEK